MMTENQFDDFFRKKLRDHESAVPDDAWEKIRLRKENPRRRIVFWWSIAAMLILTAGAGSYLLLRRGTPVMAVKKTTVGQDTVSIDSVNKNNKLIENNTTLKKETTKPGNSVDSAADEVANKENAVTENKTSVTANGKLNRSNNVIQHGLKEKLKTVQTDQGSLVKKEQTNNADKVNDPQPLLANDATTKEKAQTKTSTPNEPATATPSIKDSAVTADNTKPAKKEAEKTVAANNKKVVKYREPKNHFIELYASPGFGIKQTTGPSSLNSYISELKGAEKTLLSYNIGLRFTQMLNDHFFIKAGLQYAQVNERFKYRGQNEYRIQSVLVARTIPNVNNNNLLVSTSSYRQAGYYMIENNNRYSSIELPLLVGYQTTGSTLNLAISAGPVFNLHSWYQGYTVDDFYTAADINKQGVYRKTMGLGLYFGVGLYKPVSDKLSLFGEPYFIKRLGNITNASAPYQQKVNVAGLSLGLRYKF